MASYVKEVLHKVDPGGELGATAIEKGDKLVITMGDDVLGSLSWTIPKHPMDKTAEGLIQSIIIYAAWMLNQTRVFFCGKTTFTAEEVEKLMISHQRTRVLMDEHYPALREEKESWE